MANLIQIYQMIQESLNKRPLFYVSEISPYTFMHDYQATAHGKRYDYTVLRQYGEREFDLPIYRSQDNILDVWRDEVEATILKNADNLQRAYDALLKEYDPLANYDKHSTITTDEEGTTSVKSGTIKNVLAYKGSEKNTTSISGKETTTGELNKIGKETTTGELTKSGKETTTGELNKSGKETTTGELTKSGSETTTTELTKSGKETTDSTVGTVTSNSTDKVNAWDSPSSALDVSGNVSTVGEQTNSNELSFTNRKDSTTSELEYTDRKDATSSELSFTNRKDATSSELSFTNRKDATSSELSFTGRKDTSTSELEYTNRKNENLREFTNRTDEDTQTLNTSDAVDLTTTTVEHTTGNIGVTRSQEMLSDELQLRFYTSFYDMLFKLVLFELTY